MEKANILLFEPSEFMRLFIRKALEDSNFTITEAAGTAEEATRLIDLDRKHETDLVIVSDEHGTKAAKRVLDHLARSDSPAKTLGIYRDQEFHRQRLKVTSDIRHDDVVNNPTNLRNLIAQI
jgi:DNA-binding NarL/FixJ family response regulator